MKRFSSGWAAAGVVGLAFVLIGSLSGDVLGDFSSVTNDPGYLSFSEDAPSYRGNVDLPGRVQGVAVETRMPARVLYEDYVDPETRQVRPDAVLGALDDFRATHATHLRAYCIAELIEEYQEEVADTGRAENSPIPSAVQHEARQTCQDVPDAIRSRWEHRKDYAAYRFVEHGLHEAHRLAVALASARITIDRFNEDLDDVTEFRRRLFEALEVHESLRLDRAGVTNRSNRLPSLLGLLRNYLRRHRLEADRPEATNLLVPSEQRSLYPGQLFFSPEQLEAYAGDPGHLDPPNSGFWRKPTWAISSFSMTDYHRLGLPSLRHHHDDEQFDTPDLQARAILDRAVPVRVVYRPDELKGRTPKMTVRLGGQNWKLKFVTDKRNTRRQRNPSTIYQKRWLGSEVNVEPVVNHLAAALGYTVDPTYYQERVHLYFEDEVYEGPETEHEARFLAAVDEMTATLADVFPSANVASAFRNIRIDAAGRRYLEVRSATLEKKSDESTDINIGYFIRSGYGKSFKREFRAFGLFLAWVGDPDIKDPNVKAKLIPVVEADGRPGYRLGYSASDMGGALGTGLPNLFGRDLVHGVDRDWHYRPTAIHFTYRSIYPAPLLASASFSDARWVARMIGQLSREQIVDACRYAGFPEVVAQYYADVLLRRRDQLLDALGLLGETVVDADGHEMRLVPLSRMDNPVRYRVEGDAPSFRRGFLRDPDHALFDSSKTYFPRYWDANYPWVF